MPKANKRESVWPFFSGVVIADLSILLIGLGGWDALIIEAAHINLCYRESTVTMWPVSDMVRRDRSGGCTA